MLSLLEFQVGDLRLALQLGTIERVLPMVRIAALPDAPECAAGVINVHGQVVPVVDLRKRLERPQPPFTLDSRLVLARSARRRLALAVDAVQGVCDVDTAAVAAPSDFLPGLHRLSGIVALADGLLLIQNLDALLSWDEEQDLDRALQSGPNEG